jgi:hypothetical protein
MTPLTPLELEVLRQMLDGSDPALEVLRRQVPKCQVTRRTPTGVGFFSELEVVGDHERAPLPGRTVLEGVSATFPSLAHGAGFLLYVEDGSLEQLEGFSYDEPWPESEDGFTVRKVSGAQE